MSNQSEVLNQIKAAMADDSQEQPETIEAESTETEEVELEATAEVEEDTGEEVDTVESPEGVEENDQEMTGSDDDGEFFYEIGDKEYSASEVESWKDNGLRQSDYTQKTQKLSEDRKTMEADFKSRQEELDATIAAVRDLVKVDGDWEKGDDGLPLYDEDMAKFQRAKAKQDSLNDVLNKATKLTVSPPSADKIQEEIQKLTAILPDFGDQAKQADILKGMEDCVKFVGSPDVLLGTADHRIYHLVHLAAIGLKLSQSGESIVNKRVKKAPKLVKPKQVKKAANLTERQEAQERFRKSGGKDMKSGVAAIRHLM